MARQARPQGPDRAGGCQARGVPGGRWPAAFQPWRASARPGGAAGRPDRSGPGSGGSRCVHPGGFGGPARFRYRRGAGAGRGRLRGRTRLPVRHDGRRRARRGQGPRHPDPPVQADPATARRGFGGRVARGRPRDPHAGMMVSGGQLLGFTLASLVLIVIPGPGVLFIVGRALAHGRRTALATACGHAAGNYVVAACVALGLGALLQRSASVFVVVKLAGALYLVWLGVHAIRHRKSLADAFAVATEPREGWRAFRDGVVVGVTNPKSYILFGAILPQFVSRAAGNVPAQMLLLALVSVAIGAVSDCGWGFAASAVRGWFARSPRRFELVGGAGGLAMIGVGVTVAVTGRTS